MSKNVKMPVTVYVLTGQNNKTKKNTSLDKDLICGKGVTHKRSGKGHLYGPGWIHSYTHPLMAVLFNHITCRIDNPILWESEGSGMTKNDNIKMGFTELKIVKKIELPLITPTQLVAFAILCGMKVEKSKVWRSWARKWLNGKDRSKEQALLASSASKWASMWSTKAAEMITMPKMDLRKLSEISAKAAYSIAGHDGDDKINLLTIAKKAMAY